MSVSKLPPQIKHIRKGMRLKFIRQVQEGNVYLNKASGPSGREVDVISHPANDGKVLVAFKSRIRNTMGQPVEMHFFKGFRYVWLVSVQSLINNCKEVK